MNCPAEINDGVATVRCAFDYGHDDDHGRGFLRWDNDGWYACRAIGPDGTSIPTAPTGSSA